MKHRKTLLMMLWLPLLAAAQTVTLDECQQMARDNYPAIKRYDLIRQTTGYTVDNLSKGWLPQVSAVAQATLQSDVPTLPAALRNMLSQQGYESKGLAKDQYRVGIDVSQTVWDGGLIRNQKELARLQGDLQTTQTDVELYAVRQRVNDLFFGILLLDAHIAMNADLQALLGSNLDKLRSMLRNGVAMESDVNSVQAELLRAGQQATELNASRRSLCCMLAVFTGQEDITAVVKPADTAVGRGNNRPELRLYDQQIQLAGAQERLLKSGLMPRLSVFAQGYYGYPGYDMFHDMFHREWTLNGLIGARLTWNIGSLYTNRNDRARLQLQREQAENSRETFLFNNRLTQVQQGENIGKYRQLLEEDERIVGLRGQVRRSAESKLKHGIIDVNGLLQEISRENQAKIDRQTHEVQMLQEIYGLKYTVNN